MSRLDDLIHKLCPNGVRYYTVDELIKNKIIVLISPIYKIKQKEYLEIGSTPIISQEAEYISGYTNLKDSRLPNDEYVCFGDHTEHLKYVNFEFVQGADGLKVMHIENKEVLNTKYYYYVCSSYYLKKNTYERHFKYLRECLLPLPPLEVQQEIVHLLDDFTAKTAELQAELNKEYETRKTQCEYYHNNLMKFSDKNIECKTVGELFEIKNGLNKPKEAFGHGKPIVNFTDVYNKRWLTHDLFQGLVDVDEDEIKRYSAKKGDVFFTRTSETKEDVGMSCTLIDDVPDCVYSGFLLRARPITNLLLPKFCSYYFSTDYVRKTIVRYAAFTTRATTTGPKLSKIEVPILPLEEQQRIVDILDDFYLALNKLQSELPAEIESRQKQYEYYRDKLLTFKELNESEVN